MHIPDGLITDPKILGASWLGSAGAVGYAARAVRTRMSESRIVLMAVLAALVFALQMLNFPLPGGTSGHFAGGAAAAILLGPWPAVVVLATVLIVQALVFSDGGAVALGANMLNLAVIAPLLGWLVWRGLAGARRTTLRRNTAAFAAGWVSVVAAAFAAALEIALSGRAPMALVLGAMAGWHALIGIGEGLITLALVEYVSRVRPDLAEDGARTSGTNRGAGALALLAVAAAGASFLASAFPDGLERVALSLGIRIEAPARGLLAGYSLPGAAQPVVAGLLAAIAGTVLTGAILYTALGLGRKRVVGHAHAMSASVDSLHRHEHAHADEPVHAHPHHHRTDERGEHGHAPYFERYTYIVSPVHALDPRAKLVAALALVLAVSLSPLHIVEIGLVAVLLAAVTVASRLPLAELGWRSALVLPFAGAVAVLSPLQAMAGGLPVAGAGWGGAAGVLAKAWLSAYCLVLVTATTPVPRLIEGLRRLWLPTVVVTLLSFVYRYVSVLAEQVRSMRRALASRGFGLGRLATLRLYGNLAGNLFVRSYERGERVHSAMLARGYDGRLPIAEPLALRGADALTVVVALLTAAAVLSY